MMSLVMMIMTVVVIATMGRPDQSTTRRNIIIIIIPKRMGRSINTRNTSTRNTEAVILKDWKRSRSSRDVL